MALPTSPTWNIADFGPSTIGGLLSLGPGDLTITPGASPYFSYNGTYTILTADSRDGVEAKLDFNVGIPARFTVEFEARFPFMPHNMGDLENRRVGITVADDAGRGVSLYFAATGVAVARVDDFGSVSALPGTTDTTEEIATAFRTVRVAVDSALGRAYVFVSTSGGSLELRYILPVEETPASVIDRFQVFTKGVSTQPSTVEFRALRLAGDLIIPNYPPVADPGPDRVAPVGQSVRFDGRASFDVEGAPLSYLWRAIDAPYGSQYVAENSSGSTVDDGDGDGNTLLLSFPPNTLPGWVSAGDVLQIAGSRHVIDTFDNPTGQITVTLEAIPDNLSGTPFRIIRQSLLVGATTETPYIVPDVQGIYRFELVVNDGEVSSEPREVLANIVGARTPFGVEPDVRPIWNALGDEWRYIQGKEVFEEVWRGAAQILAGKLLEVWQYHYNYSIRDAQRTFQKKWIAYRTLVTETDPDKVVVSQRPGLLRASHRFESGLPTTAGLTLDVEYFTGDAPSELQTVTVTFAGNTLYQIIADLNAALAGTDLVAYGYGIRREDAAYRYDGTGSTVDDGDGDGVTLVLSFPPASLPSWVSGGVGFEFSSAANRIAGVTSYPAAYVITAADIGKIARQTDTDTYWRLVSVGPLVWASTPPSDSGDTLIIDGNRYTIDVVDNAGGTLHITTESLPDSLSGAAFRIYRACRLGIRSSVRAFRVASSAGATALGIPLNTYSYLSGANGAYATDRSYYAGDGVNLLLQGVTREDLLIINNGQALRIDRASTDPLDPLPGQRILLLESLPFDASAEWQVPSVVRSNEVDYESNGSYPNDLVKSEIFDGDANSVSDARSIVVGQRGKQLAVNLDDLYGAVLDPARYEIRLLGVKRRKGIPIDASTVSIPRLQDQIPLEAKDEDGIVVSTPTYWKENEHYVLEPFYRDTDGSAIPFLQFRDSTFVDPDLEPPDIFWAELTVFSNDSNVENLFGRLAGFLRDDASLLPKDFNYVAGVAGLMYAQQRGPSVFAVQVGAQVLFGQPFAEVTGVVEEIRSDYSPTVSRILIRDADGNTPTRSEIVRTYYYKKDPLDLSVTSGLATNPATGVPWAVGDTIEQFQPIGVGVNIVDLYNTPEWYIPFVRGGLITEIEKFHYFLVTFNFDLVNLSNIVLLSQFIQRVKPTYTHPLLVGLRVHEDDIDVVDELDGVLTMHLYDSTCGMGRAFMYDDYRGDGTIWSGFDDGISFFDAMVDCPTDIIEFCMLGALVDTAAVLTGSIDLTLATYPGDFAGNSLELIIDGVSYVTVFGAVANAAAVVAAINAVVGAAVASLDASNQLVITSVATGTQNYLGVADGTSPGGTTLTFTPASLPAWVSAGDFVYFEGVIAPIATVNNGLGTMTVVGTLPAAVSQDFRVWESLGSVVVGPATTAGLLPVIGIYVGQTAYSNAVTFDGFIVSDTTITDSSGVVGSAPGDTFSPVYDMTLPAGSYRVCAYIKSGRIVLPPPPPPP